MSYQRFCGLADSASIPDRTTIWTFENRIGEAGAKGLFDGVEQPLLQQGYIARGGQIIDATLIPAPKQHFSKEDKEQIKQDALPTDWKPAKRRQKDLDTATVSNARGNGTSRCRNASNGATSESPRRAPVWSMSSGRNRPAISALAGKTEANSVTRIVSSPDLLGILGYSRCPVEGNSDGCKK